MTDATAAANATSQGAGLSGQIVPARVRRANPNNCDLDLLGEGGTVIAKGRLYQDHSLAADDRRLMCDIAQYGAGTALAAVFIVSLRNQDGESLWFVNERWGLNNPWPSLALDADTVITGMVVRRVGPGGRPEPAGYIVQLDTRLPLYRCIREGLEALSEPQPDIEVFLPVNEIPLADGGLRPTGSAAHLRLDRGDRVRAIVLDVALPPNLPRVSITRLIDHLDACSDRAFAHRETLARWRFRRLLGHQVPAQADQDAVSPRFAADEQPYAGRRLLLVDDDWTAAASQAELLGLMGAEVTRVEVKAGGFREAVADTVRLLSSQAFDLTLVDNNLPGRDLGRSLIRQVRERLGDDPARRLILLTANASAEGAPTPEALRAEGITGLIHRPMAHRTLQRLLDGEEVWDRTGPLSAAPAGDRAIASRAVSGPQDILATIANQPGVRFAVLFPAHARLSVKDFLSAGQAPFEPDHFDHVREQSSLDVLIDGRADELSIAHDNPGDELLRPSLTDSAHWSVLEPGGTRWVLGIGFVGDGVEAAALALWRQAVGAALEARDWRAAARHQSAFLQAGLAMQGLTHEIFNLQDEFGSRLGILRRRIDRLRPEDKVSTKERDQVDEALRHLIEVKDQILAFAKAQLRAEAQRHQLTFLPPAITSVQRIVQVQCDEAEVQLAVAAAPPLALPVPTAALVLPLVNLIINAAKHQRRRENRRVEVSFDLIEQDGTTWFVAEVRDNGFGLDQLACSRLFEPGRSDAPDPGKRHGIGLWLSRQLVAEAGGRLDLAENWRGVGACFRLQLPVNLG